MPDMDKDGNRVYLSGLSAFDATATNSGYITEVKAKKVCAGTFFGAGHFEPEAADAHGRCCSGPC